MSTETNKDLIRRWFYNLGRPDWRDHLAEFIDVELAGEHWLEDMALFREAFPDYCFSIDCIMAESDCVMCIGHVKGTHVKEYPRAELRGIPGTGLELQWPEAYWHRIEDGKIVDGFFMLDGLSRLQQMGVWPEHIAPQR